MSYPVIVSDLDGTLLNNDHAVPDFTLKVLRTLMDQGIFIIIATLLLSINISLFIFLIMFS